MNNAQQETDRRRAHAASLALQAKIKRENAQWDALQERVRAAKAKQERATQ